MTPLFKKNVSGANSINNRLDQEDLISGHDIKANGLQYASIDTIQSKLRLHHPLIVNTDLSSGGGIHWFVLYPTANKVVVIDSLGQYNERPYDNVMLEQIGRHVFYPGRYQYDNSNQCGWFAIYVAKLLETHQPTTVREVFKLVKQAFGRTADDGDLRKLIKAFGKGSGNRIDKIFDGF